MPLLHGGGGGGRDFSKPSLTLSVSSFSPAYLLQANASEDIHQGSLVAAAAAAADDDGKSRLISARYGYGQV